MRLSDRGSERRNVIPKTVHGLPEKDADPLRDDHSGPRRETLRAAGIAVRNLLFGTNLASFKLITRPRAMVWYVTESLFLHRLMAKDSDLPQAQIWEVLGQSANRSAIKLVIYPEAAKEYFRDVPSYAVDLVALCTICQILRPRVIFEIGTLRGSGALHLAGNSPEAQVFTLDLGSSDKPSLTTTVVDDSHVVSHAAVRNFHFSARPEEHQIRCLFGDSARFDFSPWERRVDLFFIDGAHSYEYARNDTLMALQCVQPGGVIAWHDYGRVGVNGVSKWLHELRDRGHKIYRVPGGSLAFSMVGS